MHIRIAVFIIGKMRSTNIEKLRIRIKMEQNLLLKLKLLSLLNNTKQERLLFQ